MREHRTAKIVFTDALNRPEPERSAFLDHECEGDEELRAKVDRLLSSHGRADHFLETGSGEDDGGQTADEVPLDRSPRSALEPPPEHIGPYRIVREIKRGGMGVLYLGLRDDDRFQKAVAVKVLKRGMDTDDILRRFELERQVLAALNDPYIARLLDAGGTIDGRPYFVLEYVEGEPIDEFCDSHGLSTAERLSLFAKVCRAVNAAHQNLIVHRDLKPANILVTEDGVPKLLDFGIAKIVHPDRSPAITDAPAGQRALTPEYASPEQVTGKPIGTPSDVYSLGVVLYELLTGHRPYRLTTRTLEEILYAVCNEDPDRPSTVVTRSAEVPVANGWPDPGRSRVRSITPEAISRTRGGHIDRLRRDLQGDVDNIVLKALQKAPRDRYGSADDLARDIERHLQGFPITARPDSVIYRSRKFVRRHKAGVAIGSLVVVTALAVTFGIVAVSVAARGTAEDDRNQQFLKSTKSLREVLLTDVYKSIERLPGSLATRQLIVDEVFELLETYELDETVDREVWRDKALTWDRLGDVQGGLRSANRGEVGEARASYEEALEIRRSLIRQDPDDPALRGDLARSYRNLGDVEDDPVAARDWYERALEIQEKLAGEAPDDLDRQRELAITLLSLGDKLRKIEPEQAAELWGRSMDLRESIAAERDDEQTRRDLGVGLSRMARAAQYRGAMPEAASLLEQCTFLRRELADEHPDDMTFQRDLAMTGWHLGKLLYGFDPPELEQARQHLVRSAKSYTRLQATDPENARYPRDAAAVHEMIGHTYYDGGELERAIDHYREQQRLARALVDDHPENAQYRRIYATSFENLGRTLAALGRPTKAAVEYGKCLETIRPLADHDERSAAIVDRVETALAELHD